MPPVNKVLPNSRPQPRLGIVKPSSLLSQAISVSEIQDEWVKLTLYGQNRVGKTTLACQFPKPLLVLSFEPNKTGGANSIRRTPGVKLIRIKYKPEADDEPGTLYGTQSALQIAQELRVSDVFKTVVLDSATSFQDLYLQEILGLDHLPEQLSFGGVSGDQYRVRSEKIKEGLRPFLNLNKHVVITAKEKDHNPPKEERMSASGKLQPDMRPKFLRGMQQESFVASDLGGAAVGWLHDACDYIGRLYLAKEVKVHKSSRQLQGKTVESESEEETGRITHRIRTMYHPNFAAGFRSPDPSTVPEYVEGFTPDELYQNLMSVIRGTKK